MDMLVEQTHELRHEWRNNERPMRFTDTRLDEQQRGVSLKMVPMSLLLEASSGKSYLMNLIDTPGESFSSTSRQPASPGLFIYCFRILPSLFPWGAAVGAFQGLAAKFSRAWPRLYLACGARRARELQ